MNLRRMFRADVTDLVNRGWQEMSRSLDRMAVMTMSGGTRALSPFDEPDTRQEAGERRHAAHAQLEAFRRRCTERFFAGVGDPRLPSLIEAGMPEVRSAVIAAADAACERSFSLLGHRALFLGEPIDWHLDAVSGQKAPFVHWSRIDPLDQGSVGDSKVTWELNRHQWLVDLGQAYRLTGDERYATAFAASVRDWMRANPPGMGINWASSLEVSYRMISWCWALNLFRDCAALTPQLYVDMVDSLRAHGAHVERYLSHYFSPNTHLTGEALGLFYVGVLFPELPRAQRWRRIGARILLKQLPKQVLPDGVYFEQSTCYQRYTAEIYLHFIILAARNGVAIPAVTIEHIGRLLDHLFAVCRPDGSMPQIGDSDGGRLLRLAHRSADDCRDVFSVAAALFKRPDYAWAAHSLTPETAWLLGPAGCESFAALKPEPPAHPPSRLFPEGGYAVMQGGWARDAHQLLFDVGPLGCWVSGGHGHADLLSIQACAFGRPQLVDPGTYCYTAHTSWRDHFRSTAAHSSVAVDRQSQALTAGPFSWRKRPRAHLRAWLSTAVFDYADADHDAYRRLRDPVRHRRRVLFVKPRYWVVVDDITGADVHQVDLSFQFGPARLAPDTGGWMHAPGPGGGLHLKAFSTSLLQQETHEGEVEPIRGWVSSDYGLRAPAPLLCYTAVTKLPLRVVTLLIPSGGEGAAPPDVTQAQGDGVMNLAFAGGKETLRIDDRRISVTRAGGPDIEPVPVD